MHPSLYKPHPKCEHLIQALVACHEQYPMMKFFGQCNEFKAAMDTCFREEKVERRRLNLAKAREAEQRWKDRQIQRETAK